jgi:hypothetical protein
MRRRRRSLRACLLPKAGMVVSSWMRRSLALLLGSTLKSGRRGVIGLLHARGEVHQSRRVDILLVTLVAGAAVPHTGAARVDGDEATPLLPLDEVVRSNTKGTDWPLTRTLCPSSPSGFYTTPQNHPYMSVPLVSIALTLLAPTFMTSPYPRRRVLYCTARRASRTTFVPFDILSVPR